MASTHTHARARARAHVHTSRHGACVHGACLLHGSSEHIRSAQRKPRRALSGETSRRSAEGGRRLRHLCTCTDRVPRAVAPKLTAAVLTRVALAVAVPRMGMRARVLYSVWHLELQLVLADGARVASPVRRPTSDAAVQPRHLHASVGRGVGQGAIRAGACVHVHECDGAAAPARPAAATVAAAPRRSPPTRRAPACKHTHMQTRARVACASAPAHHARPSRPPTTHRTAARTSASEASSSTRAAPSAAPRGAPRSGASSCAQKAGRSISSRDQIAARSRSASGSVRPCRVLELRGRRGGRSGSGRGRRSRRSRRARRPRMEFPAATAAAAVAASTSRSRRDRPGD